MSNSISVDGNLGQDADLKYTPNGDPVLSFSVACETGYDRETKKPRTAWYRCSWFGKRAESIAPYLLKGSKVSVHGEHDPREWKDNEGGTRFSNDIRVDRVTLMGGKPEGGTGTAASGGWNDKPDPFD